MIRLAVESDLPAIAGIYDRIHDAEESGALAIGWRRGVYPTLETARAALTDGDLFALEDSGRIIAAARINRVQMPAYAQVRWKYPADDDQVMVLHTLTVDPAVAGRGYGRRFIEFYERYALEHNCTVLRIDTNAINVRARGMYARHGYVESGIIPTAFNGIPGVMLVCMEKRLVNASR